MRAIVDEARTSGRIAAGDIPGVAGAHELIVALLTDQRVAAAAARFAAVAGAAATRTADGK